MAQKLPDNTQLATHMENIAYELNFMKSQHQIYSWGVNWGVDRDRIDITILLMASVIYEEVKFTFKHEQIKTISDVVVGRIRQILTP